MEVFSSEELVVKAPAKINLVLRVLDRRPDGYHNLWSLMQTVGLEDELQVRVRPDLHEVTVWCDDPTLPTDARNLVHQAVTRVLEAAGRRIGVDVHVTKRIPMGGGLGGGSSDAAAMIVALNRLLGLGWSVAEMARVSESLGSDVPFFFHAPTAIVRGRGGDVVPVSLSGSRWIVLVNPGFPVETRWAYEQLSRSRSHVPSLSPALLSLTGGAALAWEDVIPLMANDFEEALKPTHPALNEIKHTLLGSGAEAALLSGSGATVFGVFRQKDPAARARDILRQREGYRAYAVPAGPTPSFGLEGHAHSPTGSSKPALSSRSVG